MRKKDRVKKKIFNYFFDHPLQRNILSYLSTMILSAVSGMIFAFGFSTFITPYHPASMKLATGGFSGFTQGVVMLINYLGSTMPPSLLQSILYFAINVPALIFAFFKIGKKFAITTTVNVGLSSVFISVFSNWSLVQDIANNTFIATSPLTRVLFAGVCTGVSSGIALKFGTSCGGMDIVTCYLGLRKSTAVGKYNIIANSIVIIFYTSINLVVDKENYVNALLIVPFAFVYFLVSSLVIDTIHVRNKKISIEIVTKNDYLSEILISILPHSCTLMEGKGAYSKSDEHIVKMVVSSFETRRVVKVIKNIDPNAFITLVPLTQVYGNFFINPVE